MEMIYFTLAAIALYFISDWVVNLIERKRGERLANRSLIFFVIIFTLTVVSFNAIQYFMRDTKTSDSPTSESTAAGAEKIQ